VTPNGPSYRALPRLYKAPGLWWAQGNALVAEGIMGIFFLAARPSMVTPQEPPVSSAQFETTKWAAIAAAVAAGWRRGPLCFLLCAIICFHSN
jgi:hypothetical protein